jgi:hypothetical protein
MKETIICSAIYYNDGFNHAHTPTNIELGYVICGFRHSNCISIFALKNFPYDKESMELKKTSIQGFLTNQNRFVGREEASQIAFDSGQIKQHVISLYSEDIY